MSENLIRLENFDVLARRIVASAQAKADDMGHELVTRRHLIAVLLDLGHGFRALEAAGVDAKAYEAEIAEVLGNVPRGPTGASYVDTGLLDTLNRAEAEARREGAASVTLVHLFRALGRTGDFPESALDHWELEAPVPTVEAPVATPLPQRSFTSAEGGFAMGRSLLRSFTEDLHVALDPTASHAERRAILALDAVESGLLVPGPAPGLDVTRETRQRLRVRRARHPGEVTLTISQTAKAVVMTRGGGLTRIERFRWSEARNGFTQGDAGEGAELFEALRAAILEELYPEVTLPG